MTESLRPKRGQAMVEYALIMALLAISMGAVIWATGPAIGNVFCNVVYNISGENANVCGRDAELLADQGGRPDLFWETVTWVATNRQRETPFPTPIARAQQDVVQQYRSPTPTATFTTSMTPSQTPTPTSTLTSSPGPSPTPSDYTFSVPHVDQMNQPKWWRIDVYGNPDDAIAGGTTCAWGQQSDDANSGSRIYIIDENPLSNTWSGGNTCNLELRGSIDLSSAVNPVLSFWDYWDFVGNSGANAQVQVGNYVLNAGVLDRSAFNWCTLTLHSGNTANYNWTRSQIDIRSQCPGLGNTVTVRFIAGSANNGTLRWRLDDIQILDAPTSTSVYTINDYWNLNSRSQMSDFFFNADSDHNVVDVYPALDDNTGPRRWDLTSNISRDGTGWDDSPGNFSQPDTNDAFESGTNSPYRIHSLEFKRDIDITTATIATLSTDHEGDTGVPVLSFWFAYDVPVGSSVRVQWTRDARNRTGVPGAQNPDNWTDVTSGILLNYDLPAGAPAANEQPTRKSTGMQYIEVPLTSIPNSDTQSFRLRIAFYMTENYPIGSGAPTVVGDGVYIDDLRIERESTVGYFAYPFNDEAENSVQTAQFWQSTGGANRWGQVGSPRYGALGTSTSYGDSPAGNYSQNTSTTLQLKKQIDLLNDTPENDVDLPARAAAIDPVLTFYFVRQVTDDEINFAVDLWSPITSTWSQVWLYASATDTQFRTQSTWERAEINLKQALATATGIPWATISSDGNFYNDDFRVRFRFDTGSDITADGIHFDQIEIKNASTVTHRLWSPTVVVPNGAGGGTLEDSIDFVSPIVVSGTWDARWYGADWDQTNAAGYVRRGSLSITDSVSGQYPGNTRNILEYLPVIDLRTTTAADLPRLFFWTRYAINDNDNFRVEIAYEDATNLAQGYDKIAGWSAWTAMNTSVTGSLAVEKISTQVDTWLREDVNLTSLVGKRIRMRFVMNVPNNTNAADGVFIDDVTFTYGVTTHPLTFLEDGQSVARWITEGDWSLTQQYFAGTGTSTANLGSFQWEGWFFDCETNGGACDTTLSDNVGLFMNPILANYPNQATDPTFVANTVVGPNNVPDVNYSLGTTDLPPGGGSNFYDNWGARWIRRVQLSAGTYNFQSLSDDGVRVWLNDVTDTSLIDITDGVLPVGAGYIINNWNNHSAALDYGQVVVTGSATLDRYLYLDYFENGGDARITLSATRNSYSYSNSPNTWTGVFWDVVPSTVPGNASMMINGVIDMSDTSYNYNLQYLRMWDADANNAFYLEVSTDGGFTWATIATETLPGGTANIRPFNDWQTRIVNLNAYRGTTTFTLRFRVDTRSATTGDDGYYITNVEIRRN